MNMHVHQSGGCCQSARFDHSRALCRKVLADFRDDTVPYQKIADEVDSVRRAYDPGAPDEKLFRHNAASCIFFL